MSPFLIGVSIFATLFSTISYLTTPGEVLNHGPAVSLTGLLAIPIYYYIVGYVIAPLYMKHRATSPYALLARKSACVGTMVISRRPTMILGSAKSNAFKISGTA